MLQRYLSATVLLFFAAGLSGNDTLHIAVYDKAPFGMLQQDSSFGGLMVEVWSDINDELGISSSYHLVHEMGALLNGISEGKYNVGLGAISVTPEREKIVDFTYAVNPSGTTIGVSKEKSQISFFKRWGPVFGSLLKLIFALSFMLLTAATLVWLIEKKHVKKIKSDKNIETIADGLWWSAVTMTTVGYGDKVPMSRLGKLIGIVWIFTSIVFFSLFTASATATLTTSNEYQSEIKTIDDLHKSRVVAVSKSSGAAFLDREGISHDKVRSLNEALDLVLEDEYDAIVYNAPVLKYYNRVHRNSELDVSDDFLLKNNMAIALEPNSKWKERINLILLEKISEPKWQSVIYKYVGK